MFSVIPGGRGLGWGGT